MSEEDVQPLVSVIIPSYNHEKYIEDCLNGVFSQDYTNYEVIIRDDGSTDGTPAKIKGYLSNLKKDVSIIVEYGENIGLIRSLNWLIKKSSGEIMMICASDDIFMPGRIKTGVELHQRYSDFELFACDGRVISDSGELIRESFYMREEAAPEFIIYKDLDYKAALNLALGGFGISYNKKILEPLGYQLPETLLYEDGFLSFMAVVQNGAIVINKPLINYRRAINSLSHIDKKSDRFQILKEENRFLRLFLSLEETKYSYIKNNLSINNVVKNNKVKALNYLEQKQLILKLKIETVEERFSWNNWFKLLFLLRKSGVERNESIKILILYVYRKRFVETIINEYKNRGSIL